MSFASRRYHVVCSLNFFSLLFLLRMNVENIHPDAVPYYAVEAMATRVHKRLSQALIDAWAVSWQKVRGVKLHIYTGEVTSAKDHASTHDFYHAGGFDNKRFWITLDYFVILRKANNTADRRCAGWNFWDSLYSDLPQIGQQLFHINVNLDTPDLFQHLVSAKGWKGQDIAGRPAGCTTPAPISWIYHNLLDNPCLHTDIWEKAKCVRAGLYLRLFAEFYSPTNNPAETGTHLDAACSLFNSLSKIQLAIDKKETQEATRLLKEFAQDFASVAFVLDK